MKRRIISLCLTLTILLCGLTVYASAASTENDPLITLSYITDVFFPRVKESLKQISDFRLENMQVEEPTHTAHRKAASVPANATITLTQGQEITVLSGYGRITELSGDIINVTVGWPAGIGRATNCHRYIMGAGSTAVLSFIEDSVVCISDSVPTQFVVSPFSDVKTTDWFFLHVSKAYEKGLISGMTATTYEPSGKLTVAQAIRLAAAMNQLYHDGEVTLVPGSEGPWYKTAVDFAYEKGIIDESYTLLTSEQYDAPISRAEFVHIFYKALPEDNYTKINEIADNTIPDVTLTDLYANEIYTFYRAGILSGYSGTPSYAEHAFGSDSSINRAEVASILIRMFEADARTNFTIQ